MSRKKVLLKRKKMSFIFFLIDKVTVLNDSDPDPN